MDLFDPGHPEITVIVAAMAPRNQVPVECIKNKTDRLNFTFAGFFFQVQVLYFKNGLRANRFLKAGQVFKVKILAGRFLK